MGTLFALLLLLAAAPEPGLVATQQAAARAAGGSAAEDASRLSRARRSHWAPQLRAQGQLREDERSRTGEYRLAPVKEDYLGDGQAFTVGLAWDFSQLVYAREESQIALANAHLARVRSEAAEKAAQLWTDRRIALSRWRSAPPQERAAACLEVLRLTADLDALTGGLFRDALAAQESACDPEEKK